jgi:hypothetical protein
MSVERRKVSFDTWAKANVLRHLGMRKNLPGLGTTLGEWRGVVQLAKAKGRIPPRRPVGIRKPKVRA